VGTTGYGIKNTESLAFATNPTVPNYGLYNLLTTNSATVAYNNANALIGSYSEIQYQGAAGGSVENAVAIRGKINVNNGGTINTASALHAQFALTGTINTGYGLYIDDVTATTDYGIYQAGSNDDNFFAGNVGIGTTGPVQKLDVAGNINISTGSTIKINNTTIITPDTTNQNYFYGSPSGNQTMTGVFNVGIGGYTLNGNTSGSDNLAIGYGALNVNTSGSNNIAIGSGALTSLSSGGTNTALGKNAGREYGSGFPNTTANSSVYLGYGTNALANGGTNEIVIGAGTTGLGSNTVVLGNSSITTTALRGNVGIGTTSPLLKLDVAGSGRFTGAATSVLTGTIDPAASTTVTGVGTLFTTELVVGDRITVTGETRTVTAISTNTSLTVDTAFTDNANDTSPDKLAAIFVARDSSNVVKTVINDLGYVGIGSTGMAAPGPSVPLEISANFSGISRYMRLAGTGTKGLNFGYDSAGNFGWLQATEDSVAHRGLILNPLGGNVGIGGSTTPTNSLSFGNSAARKIWIENTATDVVGRALTVAAGGTVAGTSVSDVTGGELILQSGLGTGAGTSTISFQTGTTLGTGTTLQTMSTKMTILGSGNVGIGTTSPAQLFSVGTGVTSNFTVTSAGNTVIAGTAQISGATHTSSCMGVGTSSTCTNGQLYVVNGSPSRIGLQVAGASGQAAEILKLIPSTGGGTAPAGTINSVNLDLSNYVLTTNNPILNGINIATITPGSGAETAINVGSGWDYGAIFASGNVGIGATAPAGSLQIGTAATRQLLLNRTEIGLTLTDGTYMNAGTDGSFNIINQENGYLRFFTNGADVMRIASTGKVGIDTTAPDKKLEINLGTTDALRLTYNDANGSAATYMDTTLASDGGAVFTAVGSAPDFQFANNVGIGTAPTYALDVLATGTGIIARFNSTNATGCTLADGGTITCTSDERMKKNIEDITYGLETVKGLRPVLFNWKYEDDSTSKNLGFIAQEVEALVPKLVATDEEGMKSLNTTAMVPILTKALQELDTKMLELNNLEQENDWRDSLVAWLGNIGNGIGKIFTAEVETKNLCVSDESGARTCITKAELDALLLNATVTPAPEPTPTPEPEPQPEELPPSAPLPEEIPPVVEEPVVEPIPEPAPEPTPETTI
jgi:hypothetical protein